MTKINKILKLLESYNYPLKSGLNYNNEFTFLVAIILSAQARDDFINTQTEEFFKKFDTAEKMLKLGDGIFGYIQRIGLWRNKGENILKLSKQLVDLKLKNIDLWYEELSQKSCLDGDLSIYGEDFLSLECIPTFRLGLLELAGVGRKSANVFLNVVFNAPVIPVDTHVKRVANRLGLVESWTPLKIELELDEIIPLKYKNKISHYLIWHGRKVCKAIKPDCENCLLRDICPSSNKK